MLLGPGHPWYKGDRSVREQGWGAYDNVFPGSSPETSHLLEGTPEYIYQSTPFELLGALAEPPQVLFCLRDPAERLRSLAAFAQHSVGSLDPRWSFAEVARAVLAEDPRLRSNWRLRAGIDHGRYVHHLRPWCDGYPRDRIRIVRFEELRDDPRRLLDGLANWLGIDPSPFARLPLRPANRSAAVRSPRLRRLARSGRRLVPAGALRGRLASAYTTANTTARDQPRNDDVAVLEELRLLYEADNLALATEWHVDVSSWLPRR